MGVEELSKQQQKILDKWENIKFGNRRSVLKYAIREAYELGIKKYQHQYVKDWEKKLKEEVKIETIEKVVNVIEATITHYKRENNLAINHDDYGGRYYDGHIAILEDLLIHINSNLDSTEIGHSTVIGWINNACKNCGHNIKKADNGKWVHFNWACANVICRIYQDPVKHRYVKRCNCQKPEPQSIIKVVKPKVMFK